MKKILTILVVTMMAAVSMMAEGHLKFKGVEIDGTQNQLSPNYLNGGVRLVLP